MERQNILLGIMVLALAGTVFIWYRYLRIAPVTRDETATAIATEFAQSLQESRRLKEIKIDTSILDDSTFQALEAPPEVDTSNLSPGRPNPFLPL